MVWRWVATVYFCACVAFATACSSASGTASNNQQGSNFPPTTTPLVQLSTDTFTNASSQHATEVEPGSFAFGNTIIVSFQVGRIAGGGGADIGYAISNDGGATWQSGLLPGLTTFQGGGTNSAVSDTNPIYDAAHGVWMISSSDDCCSQHTGCRQPLERRRRKLGQSGDRRPERRSR